MCHQGPATRTWLRPPWETFTPESAFKGSTVSGYLLGIQSSDTAHFERSSLGASSRIDSAPDPMSRHDNMIAQMLPGWSHG
jgi:hypothetical protein